jgi:hypothetical protein
MPKFKLSALVSVLLVFLSGVLVGSVAQRLYMVTAVSSKVAANVPSPPPKESPEQVRKHLVAEMKQRVKLDESQVVQLQRIYDDIREQFGDLFHKHNAEARALWDKQNDEVRHILRPDQVPLYEQLRAEHEAARKAHRKDGPPPPPK